MKIIKQGASSSKALVFHNKWRFQEAQEEIIAKDNQNLTKDQNRCKNISCWLCDTCSLYIISYDSKCYI